MAAFSIRSRSPRGIAGPLTPTRDPDVLAGHLEDAAHFSGGHAEALFLPSSEADVAQILRTSRAVLPIGAQSSLTGGATPFGESLVSMARLRRIGPIGSDLVRVQAGVTLADLDMALARAGRYYPPLPTFMGAFVGGAVSTNAAGAATFKYGVTRDWVQALTVVLADGSVLDIERGTVTAHADGYVDVELQGGPRRVPLPTYRMPQVRKLSAGYFSRPAMDLIDLFIGAEGTLGIVTEATLRILPVRPAVCLVFVTFSDRAAAWSFVGRLRSAALHTWRSDAACGIDLSGIEHMDARCLALIREDGLDRQYGIALPDKAFMGVLATLELPPGTSAEDVYDQIGRAGSGRVPDTPLGRLCALLAEHDALDRVEIAAPGDRVRTGQLYGIREAVPNAVNLRVGHAKRAGSRVEKVAADVVVPFERLQALVAFCESECRRARLDLAVWGHLSDGNIHPNIIPRTADDVAAGRDVMLAIGHEAMRVGGAPLAEHGVGRNTTKQRLLAELYGQGGIDEMRRVKAAIDPQGKLAPGVIFPRVDPG